MFFYLFSQIEELLIQKLLSAKQLPGITNFKREFRLGKKMSIRMVIKF